MTAKTQEGLDPDTVSDGITVDMLTIGQFAQIGQVTHRMLRHWDTAGLLVPAHVDQASGYRSYDPSQLHRLHRIVALRQLGFGLAEISLMLEGAADLERLKDLLEARRSDVAAEYELATTRLADVQRRLDLIEQEHHMSRIELIDKPLPALRLAALTRTVQSQPEIAGVIGGMFAQVEAAVPENPESMAVARYRSVEDGLEVTAGFEYAGPAVAGCDIVELGAEPAALCGVHLGSMDRIHESWQAVHQEILDRGSAPSGPCRELYVRSEPADQSDWVTELQQPYARG